jgi:multiple sugar transport system permease protein
LPYLLSLPALLMCIGILIPFFTAVYYSMLRYRMNLPQMKGFIWFDNYINFFTDPKFWNTVYISLTYAFLTVGLELLLGLAIALLLQRPTRFNNIASILLLLPLMTAPALAALMWKLMTHPDFGVLSYLLTLIGITDFKWASDPSTALFTVLLVDMWVYTPFIMILLLAGLRSLPKEPFEAAAIDGANAWQMFTKLTLPMMSRVIAIAVLIRGIDLFRMVDYIHVMTSRGPGTATLTLPTYATQEAFTKGVFNYASTIALVTLILIIVTSTLFMKIFRVKL